MAELISIREYARRKGISHVAVIKAIRAGRITPIINEDKKTQIDPAEADKQWEANTDIAKKPISLQEKLNEKAAEFDKKISSLNSLPYSEIKRQKEIYLVKFAKAEYRERIGQLVNKDKASKFFFQLARTARDSILNVPNRISEKLAVESDPEKIYQLLAAELRNALDALTLE